MRVSKKVLTAAGAAAMLTLTACSSGGSSADSSSSGGSGSAAAIKYGDCQVYGTAGSIKLNPVNAGQLTVQTNLPSPGWWKGDTPDSITGGYEYCLAANIAHLAGLKLKVNNVSFDALVAGQTKDYDIAFAQISVTDARKKVVNFTEPYFDSNIGVLAPVKSDITADNVKSKKLGVQVGTTAVDFANNVLKPTTPVKVFQDTTSMVTAVASGQVDAAVQDTAIQLGFAKNSNGALKVIGQFKTGEQYAGIFPKDSKNTDTINKAITGMKTDGTLNKLSATWLGPELGGDPNSVPIWTIK